MYDASQHVPAFMHILSTIWPVLAFIGIMILVTYILRYLRHQDETIAKANSMKTGYPSSAPPPSSRGFGTLYLALATTGAHHATKYLTPKLRIKLTRKAYEDDFRRGAFSTTAAALRNQEFTLSVGDPNYEERQFVADCRKAGEPFPVKQIQLKYLPKRRKKGDK